MINNRLTALTRWLTRVKTDLLAVLFFSLLCLLLLGGGRLVQQREIAWSGEVTRVIATQVAQRIERYLNDRFSAVRHLRQDWQQTDSATQDWFTARSQAVQDMLPGFQALNYVDQAGVVRWVVPEATNHGVRAVDLSRLPAPAAALALTGDDELHATPPIELLQGGTGVALYLRLSGDSGTEGYLNPVFRLDKLLAQVLGASLNPYALSLRDGNHSIYHQGDLLPAFTVTQPITVADRIWTLHVSPSITPTAGNATLLLLGVVLVAALTWLLRLVLLRQQELARERSLLRSLIDAIPDIIFFKDTHSTYLGGNRAFDEYAGVSGDHLVGQSDSDLFPAELGERFLSQDRQVISSGTPQRNEEWRAYPDGRWRLIETVKTPLIGPDGQIDGLVGIGRDITQRQSIEENQRLAAAVFEAATEAIVVTDAAGIIKTVNRAFSRITGYASGEVQGQSARQLCADDTDPAQQASIQVGLASQGHWQGELNLRHHNGTVFPCALSIAAIRTVQGEISAYAGLFTDITQRKQDEAQIRHQATYDALTGLPNRLLFLDRLTQAMASSHREQQLLALLFIDLDRFKTVNDTLGHPVGDRLLVQAAQRLSDCVRRSDTVARLGGDEFTVILTHIHSAQDCAPLAEKIIERLNQPFVLDGQDVFIGASIGITLFPLDASSPEVMLRNADMAMYRAKDAGRNTYRFFVPAMNAQAQARLALENELRQAFEQKAFILHYQPIVELGTSRIIGAEALLRWRHPRQGLLLPPVFIPLAEDMGLINPLGEWALATVCAQMANWRAAGLDLRVSLNLSSQQLRQDRFLDSARHTLADHHLPADRLILEIAETQLLDAADDTRTGLASLRTLGVSLALDDFGTGYSSLAYLKRFPFDMLKIDGAFIGDIPQHHENARLVEALIALAHSLDLCVIAEGVETLEQAAFLHTLHCDYAQGYHFGKPMSARALTGLLLQQTATTLSTPAPAP